MAKLFWSILYLIRNYVRAHLELGEVTAKSHLFSPGRVILLLFRSYQQV